MVDEPSHGRTGPPPLHAQHALFLDVDGTLTDFRDDPACVNLPSSVLHVLEQVSDFLGGALALVSGRTLAQLDQLLSPRRFPAAGLHGQQLRDGADAQAKHGGEALSALRYEAHLLAARHPGILVEDKGPNLALHWRALPSAAALVMELARSHLPRLPGYRIQAGDHVAELMPSDIDKGRAVRVLMATSPFAGRVPVFVGDDLSDEYGFAAVHAAGGWSVQVGRREPSQAMYRLSDPGAVHAWLRGIA